jgi:uncharacterized membrane protein
VSLEKLLGVGLLMVLAGFFLVMLGSVEEGSISTGGVVFIGPFPIVFGSGPGGGDLALLSVVTGGVIFVLLILWGRRALSGTTTGK